MPAVGKKEADRREPEKGPYKRRARQKGAGSL